MKKETVTGYFVIMTEYTVEIAVEQESEVLSLHRFNFNMLQRSKTYDFVPVPTVWEYGLSPESSFHFVPK